MYYTSLVLRLLLQLEGESPGYRCAWYNRYYDSTCINMYTWYQIYLHVCLADIIKQPQLDKDTNVAVLTRGFYWQLPVLITAIDQYEASQSVYTYWTQIHTVHTYYDLYNVMCPCTHTCWISLGNWHVWSYIGSKGKYQPLVDITKQPHSMKLSCCTNMYFFTDSCLSLPRQQTNMKQDTWPKVLSLLMSTKLVVTHRQNSICPCRAHAVLSMCYNYYMQYCWIHTSWLLGYLVHTCYLPIDIQQIYCSTQTGQHCLYLQHSCCPVWVLLPVHVHVAQAEFVITS